MSTSPKAATANRPSGIPPAIKLLFFFLLFSASIGLYFGIVRPTAAAAREAAARRASASFLTSVYTALTAYASDNQGALPESRALLSAQLVPRYLPSLEGFGPPAPDYYYVPLVNLRLVNDPASQMILFERPGLWRFAGGTHITADGTSHMVPGLKFDEMVKPLMTSPAP